MYNSEQKSRFISAYLLDSSSNNKEEIKNGLNRLFDRLSLYEEKLGKDFSMMDESQIYGTLSSFLTGGMSYQASTLSTLSNYFNWCIDNCCTYLEENILIGKNAVDFNTSESYASIMVKDENELVELLDEVMSPLENDTIDNFYRVFFHLLFAGLVPEQIMNMKANQVDFEKRRINTDIIIDMSDILYKVLKYWDEMEFIVRAVGVNGLRQDEITKTGYLLENTASLNDKNNPDYRDKMQKSINVAISKKLRGCCKKLNQTNIILSGIFSRIYKQENDTGEIVCTEYLNMKRNNVTYIDNPKLVTENCKREYSVWKKAFYAH